MRKNLKYSFYFFIAYILICLITPFNNTLRKRSTKNQINYLSKILEEGYDNKLQKQYPEGKVFSNAILALSVIEFSEKQDILQQKYARIVDDAINRIKSESALQIFDKDLTPEYGMFYNGWTNLVYSSYMKSELFELSAFQNEIKTESDKIEKKLLGAQADTMKILDSYRDSNWPADNMVGIASLNNHIIKKRWINSLLQTTEHFSGLMHHSNANLATIRGSSSAMITYFLKKAEYNQNEKYNQNFQYIFIDKYFGVELVKENEDGSNKMDLDSGPVLFGYGASATIMNIKTQASFERKNAKITWAFMNLISIPVNLFQSKFHLMKQEPMFDLFMLWCSTEL